MDFFSDAEGQLTQQVVVGSAKFLTRPRFQACPRYLQVQKGLDEKLARKIGDTVFSIITLSELSVAMETRVLNQSESKLNAAFSHPSDALDKI